VSESSHSQGTGSVDVPRPTATRPLLVYDGDCGFCAYWARYWKALTGDEVDYQPFQAVAHRFPAISTEEFRSAVRYVRPDGTHTRAAEASFLTLSHARGKEFWLALYRHLPGFARASELAYAFIAAHREGFYRISLALWGKGFTPPRHENVSYLFLRALGLIYLAAFVSFGVQAQGLIGSHGILPVAKLVEALEQSAGPQRLLLMPMVFWINASDIAIWVVCWGGAVLALLLTFNLISRTSLFLLYALYLSLLYGGQEFMTYQWDTYLLETGFLALLMSISRTPGLWLLRWLLFRFMFMSGVVKLVSGDPSWWNLSALTYHFLTQPLPTPLAWYAARLPAALLAFCTGSMLVIELVLPFLIFCPRRLRFLAACGILLLQSCILVTGNYNWFNLQTMLLCLLLFDDAAIGKLLPRRLVGLLEARTRARAPRRAIAIGMRLLALLIVFLSVVQMDERFGGTAPAAARAIEELVDPLHMVSGYGLFAVMTTERDEIILEGSNDGAEWHEYEFRYKPGDVTRRPLWNIPHQPRLDWQMWFAALDNPKRLRWFSRFLEKVLENDPPVMALMARNPFPDRPPVYLRALFYRYTFSDRDEKARGVWWDRELLGVYFPIVKLKGAP
jgi:predicted DCC family thiol-disulfide oxidoreductase YuxK